VTSTTSTLVEGGTSPKRETTNKVIAGSMAGNVLEWFDFSSYAFFASYISANFFVRGDETSGLISTFVVFGVGYFARPLGAFVIGAYGDLRGRKSAMVLTVSLMAAGTGVIAVAPPVWAIGIGAPILILVGRLLQGFSAGGEIGSASSYLVEKAPADKKIAIVGWLQGTMGISNALSAVIGVTITALFTDEQVTAWAWRIPFFVGLLIIPVAIYIRTQLNETATFEALESSAGVKSKQPLRTLFRDYWRHLLIGGAMTIAWHVSIYALIIFGTTYYVLPATGLGFTANQAFTASLVGNIFMIFACVLSAKFAQRVGYRPSLITALAVLAVVPVSALGLLHLVPTLPMLVLVHTVICVAVSGYAGIVPSALARSFPPMVRSSGTSIAYNLFGVVFAGLTPAFLAWAVQFNALAPGLYTSLAGLAGLLILPFLLRLIRDVEARGEDL
jgi:MHS family proline/betaine transporter-like MFS transporter